MRRPVFAALCAGGMLLTCGGCGDANTESSTVRMELSQSDSSQTAETTVAHTSKTTRHTTTSGGSTVIASSKDSFKVSNTENAEKGFFYMEGGSADVQNAAGNGIEAVTGVIICGGSMAIHSTKKAVNCDAQSITEGCLVTY